MPPEPNNPNASRAFADTELRKVLGHFITGVTVITTVDRQGNKHGVTANSFGSVSLDPPLVQWSQAVRARSHPYFSEADGFVVNILSQDQIYLSRHFSQGAADKFAGVAHHLGARGMPRLDGCSAYLECRTVERVPGGDHAIFLGQVESIEHSNRPPLAFGRGRYLTSVPHDETLFPVAHPPACQVLQAVETARSLISRAARKIQLPIGIGLWANHGPTIVHWSSSGTRVSQEHLRLGNVLPLTTSATGRIFAAFLPDEVTGQLIAAEIGCNWPDEAPSQLRQSLDEIRQQRYAMTVGSTRYLYHYGRIDALSVPVFESTSRSVLLTITALSNSGCAEAGASPLISALPALREIADAVAQDA